ncbi:hypothetical protein ACFVWR_11985 [Leifsonia sp. NPDC058292]|uniref:hypothetical protein n=1 Tax=Leifsonia sp. NPDC058292 TaxID=3346428 RepID=UPI0036D8D8BF
MADVQADLDAMRTIASNLASSSNDFPSLGRGRPETTVPRVDTQLESLVFWLAYACDSHRSSLAFLASGLSAAAGGYQDFDDATAAGLARSATMGAR